MANNTEKYWFKRKRYGLGWMPVTWQAWLTILLYLVTVIGSAVFMLDTVNETGSTGVSLFFLVFITSTAALMWTAYTHGPKPHWRWDKKDNDKPKEDI
jgi:hypothetical protein